MQNENNKNELWKQKLNDADFLSAEMQLNKEVAWQKLHSRLQQKPKRRKAIGYWTAAACLLPLLLFVLLFHRKENTNANRSVYHYQIKTKPSVKQTEQQPKSMASTATKIAAVRKKTELKKIRINNTVIAVKTEMQKQATDDSVISNQTITADIANDSLLTTHTVLAVKTKLKVVHVNELGEPAEVAPVIVHNTYPHSFSMQIGREEVYASPVKLKNKTGFISLPTKSSSN